MLFGILQSFAFNFLITMVALAGVIFGTDLLLLTNLHLKAEKSLGEVIDPIIMVLPYISSILIPFCFTLSIYLTIRYAAKNNYFVRYTFARFSIRSLAALFFAIAFFMSGVLFILQDSYISKFNDRINEWISNAYSQPFDRALEANAVYFIDDYWIYIPEENGLLSSNFARGLVYKQTYQQIEFFGEAYLHRNSDGRMAIQGLQGYNVKGDSISLFEDSKTYVLTHYWNGKHIIPSYLAQYKKLIASPGLPLVNRGISDRVQSNKFPFALVQSILYVFSPVFILLGYLLFIRVNLYGNRIISRATLALIWSFLFLVLPLSLSAENPNMDYVKLSIIPFSLFLFLGANYSLNKYAIMDSILKALSRLTKISFRIKSGLYLFIINIISIHIKLILAVSLALFIFLIFSRLMIIHNLDGGWWSSQWFIYVQYLDIIGIFIKLVPWILVFTAPITMYSLHRKGFITRLWLSGRAFSSALIPVSITSIALLLLSYVANEAIGIPFRAESREVYKENIQILDGELLKKKNQYKLLQLPNDMIIYYDELSFSENASILNHVVVQKTSGANYFCYSEQANILKKQLFMKKANCTSLHLEPFVWNNKKYDLPLDLDIIFRVSQSIPHINTNALLTYILGLQHSINNHETNKYVNLFVSRTTPFLSGFLLLLFYIYVKLLYVYHSSLHIVFYEFIFGIIFIRILKFILYLIVLA